VSSRDKKSPLFWPIRSPKVAQSSFAKFVVLTDIDPIVRL
jgi:hypothetical protein